MTDGRQISEARPPSAAHGRQGSPSSAKRRDAAQQRNKGLSPADEQALATALARKPEELLDELRAAWDVLAGRPIRVVGRLTLTQGESGDVVFLRDFEHPETGVGLVYPKLHGSSWGGQKPALAFVPGPSREVASNQAMATGEQWAIAEVELSDASERRKHQNPWRVDVRSGTLRLLSELPEEWQVKIHGAQSVKRISASAREEIEDYVRTRFSKRIRNWHAAMPRTSGG
jgi:hypothetical protein